MDDSAVPNAKLYGGNKQRAQNNVNCLLFVKFGLFYNIINLIISKTSDAPFLFTIPVSCGVAGSYHGAFLSIGFSFCLFFFPQPTHYSMT